VKASEFYKKIMTATTISEYNVGRLIGPQGSNIASLMSMMPGVFYKTLDPHHHHRYGGHNLLVYADSADQLADALRATEPYRAEPHYATDVRALEALERHLDHLPPQPQSHPNDADDYYNASDEQDPEWEHEGESFDCMAYACNN
jgi:hypothetical protein